MTKVALVQKNQTNINFRDYFDFDFTSFYLCDSNIKKVLKKDISNKFIETFSEDNFDYVIVVGAEPAKHVAGISSVTKMQGYLVDDKYISIVSPMMLKFKPDMKNTFNKSVRDITNIIQDTVEEKSEITLNLIDDEDEANKFFTHMYSLFKQGKLKKVAVDTETSALYNRQGYILGLCIAWEENEGYYINADIISDLAIEILQKIFNKSTAIFHNYKFDAHFLLYHFGLVFPHWEDTMLIHYLLDENNSHKLKDLSIKYLDLGDYDSELDTFKRQYCRKHKILIRNFSYSMIPFNIIGEYGATDPIATIRLYNLFSPKVYNSPKLRNVYNTILKPGTEFIIQMEETGVPFSRPVLEEAQTALFESISKMEKALYKYPEIHILEKQQGKIYNTNSPDQTRVLLFDILGLTPSKKTDTGAWSTDAEVLKGLAEEHELPEAILAIKKAKKVKSTYIDKVLIGLDSDSRLRTGFHLHTTTSGRLSSSGKLNMQQLPRKGIDGKNWPKLAIQARPGYSIVNIDLKTAEMYIVSAISKDKALQKIFIDGMDYHSMMAKIKFNLSYSWQEIKEFHSDLRQDAKTVSFEILYKLNLNESALKRFPTLKSWLKTQIKYIEKHGFIYSAFGRKRRLGNVFSSNRKEASHHVRSGVNFLIQSTSSDVNLLGAIELQKGVIKNNYQDEMRLFALVHDSILAEVADELIPLYTKMAKHALQVDRGISIPGSPIGVDIEVGPNYAEVKEI